MVGRAQCRLPPCARPLASDPWFRAESQLAHRDSPRWNPDQQGGSDATENSLQVQKCPKVKPHDWTQCPFAHAGERATRRDPLQFKYSGSACADFRRVRPAPLHHACPSPFGCLHSASEVLSHCICASVRAPDLRHEVYALKLQDAHQPNRRNCQRHTSTGRCKSSRMTRLRALCVATIEAGRSSGGAPGTCHTILYTAVAKAQRHRRVPSLDLPAAAGAAGQHQAWLRGGPAHLRRCPRWCVPLRRRQHHWHG